MRHTATMYSTPLRIPVHTCLLQTNRKRIRDHCQPSTSGFAMLLITYRCATLNISLFSSFLWLFRELQILVYCILYLSESMVNLVCGFQFLPVSKTEICACIFESQQIIRFSFERLLAVINIIRMKGETKNCINSRVFQLWIFKQNINQNQFKLYSTAPATRRHNIHFSRPLWIPVNLLTLM